MKRLAYVGIILGLMLVLYAGTVSSAPLATAQKRAPTVITLDEVPTKVRPGDQVTFTGMLTTADGEPLSQIPVKIYVLTSDPRQIEVASGFTGLEGAYEVTWNVELVSFSRASADVTKSLDTQVVSLFAQFDGDEQYTRSKTGKSTVTIEVNKVNTFVTFDKKVYREGEAATVFIGFIDMDDNFVDPDSIAATFNDKTITKQLEKKKVGSYTFVTLALQKGHNQVAVIPHKAGFNTEVEVVTVTVLPEGSVGPFGNM